MAVDLERRADGDESEIRVGLLLDVLRRTRIDKWLVARRGFDHLFISKSSGFFKCLESSNIDL